MIRNAAFDPSFQFRNDVCSLLYTSIEVGQPAEILRGSKPYFMAFSQEITPFFFFFLGLKELYKRQLLPRSLGHLKTSGMDRIGS